MVAHEKEGLVQKLRNLESLEKQEFGSDENLKMHEKNKHEVVTKLKLKLLKLENQLSTQKLKSVNTIYNLR